jgi:hypothetical protein
MRTVDASASDDGLKHGKAPRSVVLGGAHKHVALARALALAAGGEREELECEAVMSRDHTIAVVGVDKLC